MQWLIDSTSHDLRHYLATIVANAEFLYEIEGFKSNRHEIYAEIRSASDQITYLLESLQELAREDAAISSSPAALDQIIRQAICSLHARPEFRSASISLATAGEMRGSFDTVKLERAFLNLFLNACEAVAPSQCCVKVEADSSANHFEVRVTDNGPGIPASIRSSLFDPYVSAGKSDGTGMGLAIVSKIVMDHGGSVSVEATSSAGTTFLLRLPCGLAAPSSRTTPRARPVNQAARMPANSTPTGARPHLADARASHVRVRYR